MIAIVVRLTDIQFTDGEKYRDLSELLTLRNDTPNPASKAFFGNGTLKIEPSSASFTNTFSNSGYSFFMEYLSIGKHNSDSDISIDSNIFFFAILLASIFICNSVNCCKLLPSILESS